MICTVNRIKLISSTYASVSRKYKRTQSPYSACFWHYLLLTAQTQPVRSGVPGLKTTMDWMKYAILNLQFTVSKVWTKKYWLYVTRTTKMFNLQGKNTLYKEKFCLLTVFYGHFWWENSCTCCLAWSKASSHFWASPAVAQAIYKRPVNRQSSD